MRPPSFSGWANRESQGRVRKLMAAASRGARAGRADVVTFPEVGRLVEMAIGEAWDGSKAVRMRRLGTTWKEGADRRLKWDLTRRLTAQDVAGSADPAAAGQRAHRQHVDEQRRRQNEALAHSARSSKLPVLSWTCVKHLCSQHSCPRTKVAQRWRAVTGTRMASISRSRQRSAAGGKKDKDKADVGEHGRRWRGLRTRRWREHRDAA